MLELVTFMAAPFVACFVLIGILGYFGLHVLKREIIFIDIALAQIAALGVTVAFLLKIDPHSNFTYLFSLGFTLLAAGFYSISRLRFKEIPQEAIIGISYVFAAALALLLTDKAAGGTEHIKEMLAGSILWVKWSEVAITACVAIIVGIFHYIFWNQFITLSENHSHTSNLTTKWRWWDFLFYASFGLVITHVVRIGGVIVVFSFLIIPATISALFVNTWGKRLAIAWSVGTIVSILGLYVSFKLDFSTGPTVVCFLGIFLLLAVVLKIFIPYEASS